MKISGSLVFKILILLLIVGYGVAGTDDYNYRCDQARKMNKRETCKMVK